MFVRRPKPSGLKVILTGCATTWMSPAVSEWSLEDAGADPGRVDGLANHPHLEQSTKNIMRGKTNGNTWVPKTLWSHPASQMQLPSIEVWFVRNLPWRCTLDEWRRLHFTGADPGFFLGGGALVSCSASTPINHIVFFLQNFSCIKKPQVISGRGGGVRTPCTLPLDPPLLHVWPTWGFWVRYFY